MQQQKQHPDFHIHVEGDLSRLHYKGCFIGVFTTKAIFKLADEMKEDGHKHYAYGDRMKEIDNSRTTGTTNFLQNVLDFHTSFNVPAPTKPCIPDEFRCLLRESLIHEETREFAMAWRSKDINGVADAIIDQLYVLFGTAIEFGMYDRLEKLWEEVHRSNMSKLDENGKPIIREDGKVMKSDRFTPPNLNPILHY